MTIREVIRKATRELQPGDACLGYEAFADSVTPHGGAQVECQVPADLETPLIEAWKRACSGPDPESDAAFEEACGIITQCLARSQAKQ